MYLLLSCLFLALFACLLVSRWRSSSRASRKRLGVLLATWHDATAEAVVAVDVDEKVVYLNPSAERLTGVARSAALGKRLNAVVSLYAADGTRVDPLDAAGTSDAVVANPPPILRTAAPAGHSVTISSKPLRGDTGRVEGAILFLRDGGNAERAARDAERERRIADLTVDAIIGVAANGTINHWNEGARRLFGSEASEVDGESLTMLVSLDRRMAAEQLVHTARIGERLTDRDLTVRSRDGREFDVSVAAFSVGRVTAGAADGVPEEIVAVSHLDGHDRAGDDVVLILRDIDERRIGERRVRRVSAQLVRRAQELQAIFDIAPVGLAIADSPDCLHIRPNLALSKALGVDRFAEISLQGNASYSIWFEGKPLAPDASPLHLAVARRAVIPPLELEFRKPGQTLAMMAYGAPVIDQDSMVVGAIAVFVDISAMKHVHAERQRLLAEAIDARRAAETASRLKEEFLATVSHELRTPLNAMHGWLEIMHRKPDAATQARGLDVIRRNVRAQTRVIEDILDVSAFVTGKARLVIRPIDLVEVAHATFDSLHPTADAKGVQYRIDAGCDVGPVSGDPERLQQMIWNLLSNAIKFTPSGGSVSLAVRREGKEVVVSVADSGEGIDPAFLPYVFDRFRQADSSIERRHSGLGLGLAIVRHLTELHGGSVAVESAGVGQGARFSLRLPLRLLSDLSADGRGDGLGEEAGRSSSGESAAARKERDEARLVLHDKAVLVVEDDVSAADMLAQALEDSGARVRVAGSAHEGLALLSSWHPDVIISDIGMPGRDGYAFIADVRAAHRDANAAQVFALAVTAYARTEDRIRALDAGFDAYLVKPATPSRVMRLLVERLKKDGVPPADESNLISMDE